MYVADDIYWTYQKPTTSKYIGSFKSSVLTGKEITLHQTRHQFLYADS
jgi:hypothetical protein